MTDFKNLVIESLTIVMNNEQRPYAKRAYINALITIKALPYIRNIDDVPTHKGSGIGEGIKGKIREILKTGRLALVDTIKASPTYVNTILLSELQKIYGFGETNSKAFIDAGLKSIEDLSNFKLNRQQSIGFKHRKDLNEKISYNEIVVHESFLKQFQKLYFPDIKIKLVGSYRRQARFSGDIDVIIRADNTFNYSNFIKKLKESTYLHEQLAFGDKKFMGICSLTSGKMRRIDFLLTSKEEYPFALLYFTGSELLNTRLRKEANILGYSLNEYSFKDENGVYHLDSEEEIFKFLGYKYIPPMFRNYPKQYNCFKIKN